MTHPSNSWLLLPLAFGLCAAGSGCQRPFGSSFASGAFAPAGTAAPQGNAPLFPIGPVTGATRVPPPPTGSAAPNAYSSPPTAFSPANTTVPALSNGLVESPSINGSVTSPNQVATNNFRSSLGGMQVIDLTGQPSLSNQAFGETSYGSNGLPIGSGLSVSPITPVNGSVALADVNAQGIAPSNALAGNSPVILRPIDTPPSASPIPRYRGIDSQFPGGASLTQLNVAPVRPAGGFANSDSWQSVQPANAQVAGAANASPNRILEAASTPANASTPSGVRTASPALPWRSPTTAR